MLIFRRNIFMVRIHWRNKGNCRCRIEPGNACGFLQICFGLKYGSISFFPPSNSILQPYLVISLVWTSGLRRVFIKPTSSAQTNTTGLYSWHCIVESLHSLFASISSFLHGCANVSQTLSCLKRLGYLIKVWYD